MLNWGILCTSTVGRLAVIPAIQRSSNGTAIAIASRSAEKARLESTAFNIPRAYGDYQDLLEDPDVDAVYIPLPNHLHREWTVRAAEAGKHVLCEKPLARDADEARAMIDACARCGVLLIEAFMYRFHPRSIRVKELIAEGAIGQIQLVRSAFAFLHRDPTDYRFRPEMGGGALLDVGGYAVSAARWFIGSEPIEAQATALFGPDSGVDETLGGLLRFPAGEIGVVTCSFRTALRQNYEVVGREGVIEVSLAFVPEGEEAPLLLQRGEHSEVISFPKTDQYQLMVEHFADCVLNGRPLRFPPTDALANMRALDALASSARTGQLVRLAQEIS